MFLRDVPRPPSDTFTNITHGSFSRSLFDHCAISECLFNSIIECEVIDYFSTSENFPLHLRFALD